MSGILDWLDTAFVVFDNPQLKDYNTAKKIASRKRLEKNRSLLEKFFEEDSKRFSQSGEDMFCNTEEVKKWRKKQKYKRNRKKPKLTHYEKVKKKLKKKTDEKRLKMIKKLKEQNK